MVTDGNATCATDGQARRTMQRMGDSTPSLSRVADAATVPTAMVQLHPQLRTTYTAH